jgi:uncharacterized delta-60 repeat protein
LEEVIMLPLLKSRLHFAAVKPKSRRRPALCVEPLESRLLLDAGDLDVLFGGKGTVTTDFSAGASSAQAVAVQPDGKVVAAGSAGNPNSVFALARYNLNGSLDPTFGLGGQVTTSLGPNLSGAAKGVAIQSDGKIVVAGFAASTSNQEFALARYNPDGSLDTNFGTGGTVLTDFGGNAAARSVTIEPDGTIVAAGSFQPNPGKAGTCFALARYHADGSLDASFGTTGKVTTKIGDYDAAANKVLIQPDGKTLAAGHTSTSSAFFNFVLARYNADGSLDTSFGDTGKVLTNFAQLDDAADLALQTDGKLVAAGSTLTNNKTELALARYNPDGSLDATFGSGGQFTTDLGGLNQAARGLVIEPDGKLLVAGVYAPQGPSEFFLARYNPDGSLDTTFGSQGLVLTSFGSNVDAGANSLASVPGGTFVAAGSSGSSFALARYWGDTAPPRFAQGNANAIFVAQVYEDLLGRPVDAGGLTNWTGALAQGNSRTWVVQAIAGSLEYQTKVVDSLYRKLLGRSADPTGLGVFTSALAAGATVEQVEAAIAGSPEYFNRAGGTNTAFLTALYRDILARPVDPAGSQTWGAALAGGMGRDAVAQLVLTSGEARQDLIESYYEQYLHRAADQGGLNTWVGQLTAGVPDAAIFAGILGSDEAFQWL